MSNAEKLDELLRSDEGLQNKVRTAMDAYEGDRSDEKAIFDAVVAPLASEQGLPVTYEEYMEYLSRMTKLPDEELDSVAGGGSYCFLLGGSNKPESYACYGSPGDDDYDGEQGAVACGFVGVGFFDNWADHSGGDAHDPN